jgi:RNA polymerase sigma-70 factor (ECF subfamily)
MLTQRPQQQDGLADKWDRAYQEQLFQYAADRVRGQFQDNTWQAFWKTAVEGRAAKEVAEKLGMSAPAVLMAKGRVIGKIQEQVRLAEGE